MERKNRKETPNSSVNGSIQKVHSSTAGEGADSAVSGSKSSPKMPFTRKHESRQANKNQKDKKKIFKSDNQTKTAVCYRRDVAVQTDVPSQKKAHFRPDSESVPAPMTYFRLPLNFLGCDLFPFIIAVSDSDQGSFSEGRVPNSGPPRAPPSAGRFCLVLVPANHGSCPAPPPVHLEARGTVRRLTGFYRHLQVRLSMTTTLFPGR